MLDLSQIIFSLFKTCVFLSQLPSVAHITISVVENLKRCYWRLLNVLKTSKICYLRLEKYWKPQKYVIFDWKNIENLKAVVKLWAWAQTPQGYLNIILIKWQNRAKLVQVWKTNCNWKGGWIKIWILVNAKMPRVKQIWEKWNRDKSCKSIGKPASSAGRPVPVLGFAMQVVPGRLYRDIPGSFGDSEQHVWWSFEMHF